MDVETKAGWIYAVRQLAQGLDTSTKTEVVALTPIADTSTASAEDVAEAVNAIIAALKA